MNNFISRRKKKSIKKIIILRSAQYSPVYPGLHTHFPATQVPPFKHGNEHELESELIDELSVGKIQFFNQYF